MRPPYWLLILLLVCAGCGERATPAEDMGYLPGDQWLDLSNAPEETESGWHFTCADPPLQMPTTVFSISEDGVIEVEGEVYECDCKVCELIRTKALGEIEPWLNEEESP